MQRFLPHLIGHLIFIELELIGSRRWTLCNLAPSPDADSSNSETTALALALVGTSALLTAHCRAEPHPEGERPRRLDRLAAHADPCGQGRRLPLPWTRRLLLETERGGRRDDSRSWSPPTRREVQIEIFRTGYYGGKGARLDDHARPPPGQGAARPPRRRTEPARVPVGAGRRTEDSRRLAQRRLPRPAHDAARRETEPYWQSYVVFIVRDNRPADMLFQCSDNTWQAYNRWPDNYSIYTNPKGVAGPWSDVSFDRPYGREPSTRQIYNNPLSPSAPGEWLCFEFPLAYWLEQQGYDVAYCSNSDMIDARSRPEVQGVSQRRPRRVLGHPPVPERDENARRRGESAVSLGQHRLLGHAVSKAGSDGRPNRIIFRGGPTAARTSTPMRREANTARSPSAGPTKGYLIGARNVDPVNGGGDWVCVKPDHWIFAGTGMKKGDRIPGPDRLGVSRRPAEGSPGLEIVAEGTAWFRAA